MQNRWGKGKRNGELLLMNPLGIKRQRAKHCNVSNTTIEIMLGLGARQPFKIFNLFLVPKNIGQHIFILARKLPTHRLKLNFMLGKQRECMSMLSYGAHCRSSINASKINKFAW